MPPRHVTVILRRKRLKKGDLVVLIRFESTLEMMVEDVFGNELNPYHQEPFDIALEILWIRWEFDGRFRDSLNYACD